MSKTLSILIVLAVITVASLLMYNLKNSYKMLPIGEEEPSETSANDFDRMRNWREFYSSTGHFKILFPALPQHATDIIADPQTKEPRKYDTFVAASNGGPAYMVSAITFPRNLEDEGLDETLESVVEDMLERNKDNKLTSKNFDSTRGFRSLNFNLSNGEMFVAGKVFVKGDTLYVLSLLTKKDLYNKEDLDFFVNSFTIQKKPIENTKGNGHSNIEENL